MFFESSQLATCKVCLSIGKIKSFLPNPIVQGYKHAILTWTWKSRVALKMKPYSCMDWGQDPHASVFLADYLQGTLGKEPIYRHISTKQQNCWMIIKVSSFSTSGFFPNEVLNNILHTVTKLKYCQCNVLRIAWNGTNPIGASENFTNYSILPFFTGILSNENIL